jgi:hypothetical protein
MKTVPVFDETELYQIMYVGANFKFNGDICEKRIRISNRGNLEFPEGAGLF